jgi:hypothetical protein
MPGSSASTSTCLSYREANDASLDQRRQSSPAGQSLGTHARIRTEVTERGGSVEAGGWVDKRDRVTMLRCAIVAGCALRQNRCGSRATAYERL